MSQRNDADHDTAATTIPRIDIPPVVPPTPEELARRQALVTEIMRIRDEIGPIDGNAVGLIDMDFYEIEDDEPSKPAKTL